MEEGELRAVEEGTPQGGVISPLLANIYLHYAFDLWACQWRRRHARGEVYVVRYADDLTMGFEYEQDAAAMREALSNRLAEFGLELHPEKTRVVQFGRFARRDCTRRGLPKPETFEFLGFVHIAGESRDGKFQLQRRTSRKKRRAQLARLTEKCNERKHWPVPMQHQWLCSVLRGHYQYYAVPTNHRALKQHRHQVQWIWRRALQRRSQRARFTEARWQAFAERFPLPEPRILHPWPDRRFAQRRASR